MSVSESPKTHLNQVVPELVEEAFPELVGIDITAEFGDIFGSFTEHSRGDMGTYTLRLGSELKEVPLPVIRGAVAMELQQIAKKERNFIGYMGQRFFEKFSSSYAIDVSCREDLDLVSRGLGKDYAAFSRHITDNCGYVWKPFDGYTPPEIEMMTKSREDFNRFLLFMKH
jgi:hypothetical protein